MNLRLRKYNISKESKDKVKELYFSAFPKDEQLPYWMMKLLSRKKSADFYSIYDKNDFVGLAYVATYKDTAYLFFFAIDEKQRGKGYGSAFLSALKEKYKITEFCWLLNSLTKMLLTSMNELRERISTSKTVFMTLTLQ